MAPAPDSSTSPRSQLLEPGDETNMNTAFSEILLGVKRSAGSLSQEEKRRLFAATSLMLISGILANFTQLADFTQGVRRYYPFVEVGR